MSLPNDIHVRRIASFLHKEYSHLIDLEDVASRPQPEKTHCFLSRSQAALALSHVAGIDREAAAASVVDGFNDNGVDAIYFDEEVKAVYVVQSKWVQSGNGTIDLGSIQKFLAGFRDLLSARFERFNEKILARQASLESALEGIDVAFNLVIVYTGKQGLAEQQERAFADIVAELNNPVDIVSYRVLTQRDIYAAIAGTMDNASISIDVTLYDWGQIREPYQAFYGQVSAEEVAQWYQEHDSKLFARNLRKFRGDTEVNRAIRNTLVRESEKFWYFNNGITVLCNNISKKAIGGATRESGRFVCEGVSVVNGAQTVGSIAAAVSQGFTKAKDARVLVRFISLENCPPGFAIEVTTATNTQNKIERRDFASLDPLQERLRTELMLDLSKLYVYKSGDKVPTFQEGCDIEEATIALATAYPETTLSADVKRYISMLWEDIARPPYTLIFNDRLTAARLWNSVEIAREVDATLAANLENYRGQARLVAVHGNRYIMHRVFQTMPLAEFDNTELDLVVLKQKAAYETLQLVEHIVKAVGKYFPDAYLNTFFKSGSQCVQLDRYLPELPTMPIIPYFRKDQEIAQRSLFDLEG